MNGAKRSTEAVGCKNASVGECSALEGSTRASGGELLAVKRKVAKKAKGTSASNDPHPNSLTDGAGEEVIVVEDEMTTPNARIEASPNAPMGTWPVTILKSNEENNDQRTLKDLLTRERHSKKRSDRPFVVFPHLSSDKAKVTNQSLHPWAKVP
ncbi:hypothetical protein LWI28_027267 [Acer negundo]|uniref:Uncharacterized protein n=1 Tax=Acer negundo TaxID=4023 RepID=A0AAD5I7R1_ACENE|nr:hypothetical protein LWI28_027267 [Acer negundo]